MDGLTDPTGRYRLEHPALGINFCHPLANLHSYLRRQGFHHVGPRPRIDYITKSGFLLQDMLGIAGQPRRRLTGQGQGFVPGIGV
ncbi:hypothetical protein D3C76_962770 [compost metagenome]